MSRLHYANGFVDGYKSAPSCLVCARKGSVERGDTTAGDEKRSKTLSDQGEEGQAKKKGGAF